MTRQLELHLTGEAEQEAFGSRLAAVCPARCLIYLEGDLGAGKTTLVRGFLRGLGHRGTVKSPTFTLIEPYEVAGYQVQHLDLYRLADPEELEYLGLRDLVANDGVILVEWAERGRGWLPAPDLRVKIRHEGNARVLHVQGETPAGDAMIRRLELENS